MISKNIFQTHEWEYDSLPEYMKQITMTWKNINPDWNYIYMGSEKRKKYVEMSLPEILPYYEKVSNISQADIWRYLITYNMGGIYADMDSVCNMSLNYFFNMINKNNSNYEVVCTAIQKGPACTSGFNFDGEFINNAIFGCVKKSTIIKNVIDDLLDGFKKSLSTDEVVFLKKSNSILSDQTGIFNEAFYGVFSNNLLKNKDKILQEIDWIGIHDPILKEKMFDSFEIIDEQGHRKIYQVQDTITGE